MSERIDEELTHEYSGFESLYGVQLTLQSTKLIHTSFHAFSRFGNEIAGGGGGREGGREKGGYVIILNFFEAIRSQT